MSNEATRAVRRQIALMAYADVLYSAFCDMVERYAPDGPPALTRDAQAWLKKIRAARDEVARTSEDPPNESEDGP